MTTLKLPTSGNTSRFTLALIGFLVMPLEIQAQRTPLVIERPPTGWFGVRIQDQAMIDPESGNAFFDSYPVVTGVDSSSPAAQAGVRPGDVLLSFNSHDMRGGSVELSKWLKVGAPFVLRIRRNDAVRVVRGTLGRRPDNWEHNMVVKLTVPEIMEMRSGATGAEFTALNQDLCDALGVKPEGVFVTSVIEGSPARAAGLRGGDVVVKADGIRIESPIDLVRAIRNADETDRSVDLQIIRKHKGQQLTLRW